MALPAFLGLTACVNDAAAAWSDTTQSPAIPTNLSAVKTKIAGLRSKLPAVYQQGFYDPLVNTLSTLTQSQWANPNWHSFLNDLVQAVIQQAEGYESLATDAFQELISDLYDGYLSAADRANIKPPDFSVLPPMVRWGSPDFGPYTYAVDDWMADLGFEAGLVSLPPSNARKGLMAWAALPHETAGHDILGSDQGLAEEMATKVRSALIASDLGDEMADYWSDRINETAADVLGILNAGPSAAIGLIAYFRGINQSLNLGPHLHPVGQSDDSHPGDLARAYLAAATVRQLAFKDKTEWGKRIEQEADAEPGQIVLAGVAVTRAQVKKACKVVAKTILQSPLIALENHRMSQIQNWKNHDEALVAIIREHLNNGTVLPASVKTETYATHVMAAAVMNGVFGSQSPEHAFNAMLPMLKDMHDDNPSWGPLFLRHPGNLLRHLFVQPRVNENVSRGTKVKVKK